MEDMLHDTRTGLTKAVVTGPGRAILSMKDVDWGRA